MNFLISGGTSGLGENIVEELAKQDEDKVFFSYCTKKDKAEEIENRFSNTKALHCDFTSETSVDEFVKLIPNISPDVLINNAYSGYTLGNYFYRTDIEDFRRAYEVNIIPVIKITQESLKVFRKKKSGKIITILTSALVGTPPMGYSVYSSTKAYLRQLALSWSVEYIPMGITSNMVSPDYMETNLTKDLNDTVVQQIVGSNALKRALRTEEVAHVVVNLANTSDYVNGVDIPINLGTNIR